MIIAAFVEGIKKKKKIPTGCYTGLAFMKKDIDVNDCEPPHPPPPNSEKKLKHPLNFQNGRYMLPVFMQNNLLRFIFLMKEENEEKKERGFC